MIPKDEHDSPVRAVRTLRILDVIRQINGGTLTDIAEEIDLPKSTLHNHPSVFS
ncbi:hypothetical protein CP556_22250 [Natrinema sp. CBA1119]|uniref:helix-turn-helix domain-containing protein n=1 Tax=Natrinema sp. CBA1119 TaxID=1608465 RepID=UPI000BF722D4|nr:hypothetical protein CP556_22250 [Natrinema sp. CBA1119]